MVRINWKYWHCHVTCFRQFLWKLDKKTTGEYRIGRHVCCKHIENLVRDSFVIWLLMITIQSKTQKSVIDWLSSVSQYKNKFYPILPITLLYDNINISFEGIELVNRWVNCIGILPGDHPGIKFYIINEMWIIHRKI